MKLNSIIFLAVLVFCLSLVSIKPASAVYKDHKSALSTTYSWGDRLTGDSFAKTAWINAINSINYDQNYVRFISSSTSTKRILNTFYESSTSLHGRIYYDKITNGILVEFRALLNVGNNNVATKVNTAKSTAVHELAHAMGLDDLSSGTSIMNTQRNRESIHTLQQIDKSRITILYTAQPTFEVQN